MIVDEATGILLKLDGIDSEGNEVEIVTVSDIRIDDVDYTNTAIDNGLTERRNSTDISNTDWKSIKIDPTKNHIAFSNLAFAFEREQAPFSVLFQMFGAEKIRKYY